MLESIITYLSSVPWYLVLLAAFFFTFLENVVPPSPSDTIIIFMGTLIGLGVIGIIPLLISTTLGSVLGFALMYYLGAYVGKRVIRSKKFSFINQDNIIKPNKWLDKYGYVIIVINRFLSGTRGVISFLAGMAKMPPIPTITLAGISALIWNLILIYAGILLGHNWRLADKYIEMYSQFVFPAILGLAIIVIGWYLFKYLKSRNREKINKDNNS